ncbi:hypothetical protein SETIT_9G177400v2 [Setaria italica]|uniref:CCHC-type domain-containing protein n=1 Tax=Setaria italica TaxID=4555 RepID=A0A368SHU2_SETIT|nr:hypothetical protein SETIT_9G177400v2 [Setaria italica]
MDSRNGNAAAAAPLPQHPHALLALPDLDRPPAVMEMWELEAVAAALPAKKRRLRETLDRLAACAPAPLPFRWEDLDTYISSLQYSVTLRRRHLREPDRSRPAPALAPAPTAVSALPSATGDPMRALEKSPPVHAPVPIPPTVSEPAATVGNAHRHRALEKSEHAPAPAPAPAAVFAPAATGVDVGKGKKRRTSRQETEADHDATRMQEPQAEMPKIHEHAAAASPLQDMNCNGTKSRPVPPGPAAADNGLVVAEPKASADATAQVDSVPVSKIAVVLQELPGPATAPTGGLPLQRSRPPLRIPASAAVSAAPVIGGQDVEAANQKMQTQDDMAVAKNTSQSQDGGEAKGSPCRPGRGTGNGMPSLPKITGVRHEFPASTPHDSGTASPPKVASFSLAKVPKQEPQDIEEVPDVEMDIVEAVEPKQEHPNDEVPDVEMEIVEPEEMQAFKEDAPVADEEASSPPQAKAQKADKVSPLPLACSNGGLARAGARAATATQEDAAGATVCRSSPGAVTRDAPNVLQAGAQKSDGVRTATRDSASNATRLAPAGSQDAAAEVSPVPPCRGNGVAQSGASTDDAMQTVAACKGAVAAGRDSLAATRRAYNATDLAIPSRGRKATGPSQAMAPPKASNNKHCGCKGHLAENCRTAKHLVALYQRAMEEREDNQICYRCGCTGHWSRNCRTPKHLVDLYQKDRAAKRAAWGTGSP